MSTTATETQPANAQHAPEITIITRIGSIPLISSSLGTINDVLVNNAYTRFTYTHAKVLSSTAYKYSEPIQCRLAPLIVRVDGLANKAVDVVESRYPYPFQAQPQEVADYVRETKDSTINGVNKAIDEKVKTPVLHVAQGVDQRFTPLVDYFEAAVKRFNNSGEGPSSQPDATYQYQRALGLSRNIGESVYVFSNEQLKQLQAHSVIVQKASETANTLTAITSSSLVSAQEHILTLSDNMLSELHKLQASASQLSTTFQANVHDSTTHLQASIPPLQQTFASLTKTFGDIGNDIKGIISEKDLPLQERISRVGHEVQNRVTPLLDTVKKGLSEALAKAKETKESSSGNSNGEVSGNRPSQQ